MPYLLRSQVPELSCFSPAQQRFLWREAFSQMRRDDPFFVPALALLFAGTVGAGVYFGLAMGQLFAGTASFVAAGLVAGLIGICAGAIYSHLIASHLRPFLRQILATQGQQLEAIA